MVMMTWVQVNAGVQAGTTAVLQNRGTPSTTEKNKRGNMILHFKPILPRYSICLSKLRFTKLVWMLTLPCRTLTPRQKEGLEILEKEESQKQPDAVYNATFAKFNKYLKPK